MCEGLPLPEHVYAIPLVQSVEVARRYGNSFDVACYDATRPELHVERDPPPHPPIVTRLEHRREPGSYDGNVFAHLDCGDREEHWDFDERLAIIVREEIISRDSRDSFSVLAGLVITISTRLRDEMSRAIERFAVQAVEASRMMGLMARGAANVGRAARVEMPRVEDLHLPRVVVESMHVETAAQYAAFVEMGRRTTVEQPFVQMPRAQHDDAMDAMNYAMPRRPLPEVYGGGRGRLAGNLIFANPVRMRGEPHMPAVGVDFGTSAITPAMQERADALLRSVLTKQQRDSLDKYGHFEVTAQSGRRYRLSAHARSFNVTMLGDKGRRVASLCVVPPNAYAVPMADQLLAQMLMLKSDEQLFLSTANWA